MSGTGKRGRPKIRSDEYKAGYHDGWRAGLTRALATDENGNPTRRAGRPPLPLSTVSSIQRMLADGMSKRAIAEAAQVSISTVHKIFIRSQAAGDAAP